MSIYYVPAKKRTADLATTVLSKRLHPFLIEPIKNFQVKIRGRHIKRINIDRNDLEIAREMIILK